MFTRVLEFDPHPNCHLRLIFVHSNLRFWGLYCLLHRASLPAISAEESSITKATRYVKDVPHRGKSLATFAAAALCHLVRQPICKSHQELFANSVCSMCLLDFDTLPKWAMWNLVPVGALNHMVKAQMQTRDAKSKVWVLNFSRPGWQTTCDRQCICCQRLQSTGPSLDRMVRSKCSATCIKHPRKTPYWYQETWKTFVVLVPGNILTYVHRCGGCSSSPRSIASCDGSWRIWSWSTTKTWTFVRFADSDFWKIWCLKGSFCFVSCEVDLEETKVVKVNFHNVSQIFFRSRPRQVWPHPSWEQCWNAPRQSEWFLRWLTAAVVR